MFPCPGCCGDAEYLTDDTGEAFSLVHCEFCGEELDDADQVLRDAVGPSVLECSIPAD